MRRWKCVSDSLQAKMTGPFRSSIQETAANVREHGLLPRRRPRPTAVGLGEQGLRK